MWGIHDGMGWWMIFGGMWSVIFWAIIIGLVIWGISYATGNTRRGNSTGESALDIAKRRFASGEITRDEFEEIKSAL